MLARKDDISTCHVSLGTAQNKMIWDSGFCEAVRHLPSADLRQPPHQLGGWIKYLAILQQKSFKNNFFPQAQQVQSTSLYHGHTNIYWPGLLKGGRSNFKGADMTLRLLLSFIVPPSILCIFGKIKIKIMGKIYMIAVL